MINPLKFVSKIFKSTNQRELDRLKKIAENINSLENDVKKPEYKIKKIDTVIDEVKLNKTNIKFLKWVSDYTLAPLGAVLKLFIINKDIFFEEIFQASSLSQIEDPALLTLSTLELLFLIGNNSPFKEYEMGASIINGQF